MLDGYEEAARIDEQLIKLLKDHPVRKENALRWLELIKTVGSTLQLIHGEANGALRKPIEVK